MEMGEILWRLPAIEAAETVGGGDDGVERDTEIV